MVQNGGGIGWKKKGTYIFSQESLENEVNIMSLGSRGFMCTTWPVPMIPRKALKHPHIVEYLGRLGCDC